MLEELKQQVFEANLALVKKGLVIETWGNVSGIDREQKLVAIKPSGVDYGTLTPENIVLVGLDNGKVIEGKLRPSSDTKTHLVLYKSFPEIGGIAHTHSTFATSWAQAKRSIPVLGTTHADYSPSPIPCTLEMSDEAIKGDYEVETGKEILETFSSGGFDYRFTPMVLVACHGPFTWGNTPEKAVYHSNVLEQVAKMATLTFSIRSDVPDVKKTLRDKHFYRKHGEDAYYGQK